MQFVVKRFQRKRYLVHGRLGNYRKRLVILLIAIVIIGGAITWIFIRSSAPKNAMQHTALSVQSTIYANGGRAIYVTFDGNDSEKLRLLGQEIHAQYKDNNEVVTVSVFADKESAELSAKPSELARLSAEARKDYSSKHLAQYTKSAKTTTYTLYPTGRAEVVEL